MKLVAEKWASAHSEQTLFNSFSLQHATLVDLVLTMPPGKS
jgi:hypothetical protein